MDRTQAAKARLRELNEPVRDKLARTTFPSAEEFVANVQCCANCVFYRQQAGIERNRSSDGKLTESTWRKSFCKRNPPTVVVDHLTMYLGDALAKSETTWPQPKHTDWCGEHRPLPGFDETTPPTHIQGFRPPSKEPAPPQEGS